MSVRLFLRHETLQHHMEAERIHVGVVEARDLKDYLDYLATMQIVHARLGVPVARARGDADEVQHHVDAIAAITADLGHCRAVRDGWPGDTGSRDYGWGISYALVGSALGARKILRALDRQPGWPRSYLSHAADFVRSGGVQRFFRALDAAAPVAADARAGAAAVFALVAAGPQAPGLPAATRLTA